MSFMRSPYSQMIKAKNLKSLYIWVWLMDQWCEDVILKAADFPKLRRLYLFIGVRRPQPSWELEKEERMRKLIEKEIGGKMVLKYQEGQCGKRWVGRA